MYILTTHKLNPAEFILCILSPAELKSKSKKKRKKMKLSLRAQKLTSSNSGASSQHNDRTTFAQSVDSEKSKNNYHYKSEHFQDTTEKLWQHIKSDFIRKKELKLIAKNKRFLKRNSTKTTKDKNGEKNTTQVETSIAREFLIQIGNESEHLTDSKSLKIYKKIMEEIAKKYKLSILQFDFHADEKVPHLHFIATTYDFTTGEFSKEFNKPNSYEKMQKDIFKFVKQKLKIELEGYEKKTCIEADYIAPAVYRKNKPLLEKAKEYCEKKEELEKALEKKPKTVEVEKIVENPVNEALQKEADKYKKINKAMGKDLETLVEVVTGKKLKSRKDIIEARESIKALKASNDTQKQDLSLLKQNMSDLEANNKSLLTANSSLQAVIAHKDKTISLLNAERSDKESGEVVHLKKQVQELEKEVSYLKSMHQKNIQANDEDFDEDEYQKLLKRADKSTQNPREN